MIVKKARAVKSPGLFICEYMGQLFCCSCSLDRWQNTGNTADIVIFSDLDDVIVSAGRIHVGEELLTVSGNREDILSFMDDDAHISGLTDGIAGELDDVILPDPVGLIAREDSRSLIRDEADIDRYISKSAGDDASLSTHGLHAADTVIYQGLTGLELGDFSGMSLSSFFRGIACTLFSRTGH